MKETLAAARALAPVRGRRLAADAFAKHVGADVLLVFVRDHELDLLVAAPGFPQTLPGGPSWQEFFARCLSIGVHDGTIAFPASTSLVPYRAVVMHDGVLLFIGRDPLVDDAVEIAASFLIPLFRAEQIAVASAGRVTSAQEAARHAKSLAAALDAARAEVEQALHAQRTAFHELKAANDERDRLLGIVGHDLRNPLTAITMSAGSMARRGGLSDEQNQSVQRIQRTANRMAAMIHGLLDRERIRTSGGLAIERQRVRVHEVIQHAVEEAQTAQPNVRIDVKVAGPALIAMWDPTRVGQLLSNLLSNAVQHGTSTDAVELNAAISDDAAQIEVSNRLVAPMAADLLEHLFDPFQKGRRSKGLGLGLHIVREIARAHGGVVHVTAQEQTITFHVRLPMGTPLAGVVGNT